MADAPSKVSELRRSLVGKKRTRAVTLITFLSLCYLVRYAPQEILSHWFEILELLLGLAVLDLVQESVNAHDSIDPDPAITARLPPSDPLHSRRTRPSPEPCDGPDHPHHCSCNPYDPPR